ncbi:hypothetical protein Q3G72_009219 [Acer saccharum]|nr:hypothetical protein Q3G72_009219 [Acer saccharum]
MGLDIFKIYVTIDTKVVELGSCDADHISMIVLLHTLSEKQTDFNKVPEDDYSVWVYLPWSSEKKEVSTNSEIVEVFRLFTKHKLDAIMFEIEKMPYIPVALDVEASSSTPPKFTSDIPTVDFSGFEQNLFGDNEGDYCYEDDHDYEGDNEDEVELGDEAGEVGLGDQSGDDGFVDVGKVPTMRTLAVLLEVPEETCEFTDDGEVHDLFEGYQSKSDDEYYIDSGDEVSGAKLARVMKSNPFKQLVGCPIRFEVGQTHDNVYTLRHVFDASIKCESVTNNMIEAFNSMLKDFRPMTYLQLMEFIRRLVMSKFQSRKDEGKSWKTDIPPCVNKKISENSEESRTLRTLHSGAGKYEMLGVGRAYTANLHEKTCECGQWQRKKVSNTTDDVSVSSSQGATTSS